VPVDLTPFGFTPTESAAYQALLARGPSNGYALAKALTIARANAYQALSGLAAKGAVQPTGEQPQRYRPLRPDVLFSQIVAREAEKLDALEAQLTDQPKAEREVLVGVRGDRALIDLATRSAARSAAPLTALAGGKVLQALTPAWRQRASRGVSTVLWSVGEAEGFPLLLAGTVPLDSVERYFGGPIALFDFGEPVILMRSHGDVMAGYWTSDPVIGGAVRAALARLTA